MSVTKAQLHRVLEEHARSMSGVPPAAFLARWVLVREVVIPSSGAKALVFASGEASGQTLTLWDAEALIRGYLRDLYQRGQLTSELPPPSPPPDDYPDDQIPF